MVKPNFLIFVVDEKRYPPGYETKGLKEWKRKNLVFERELAKNGIVFHNHYTNTNACSPARTSFHTGQPINVHGVTQTTGGAKMPLDPEATWLPPFTVPTIGNYLDEIGYTSYLKGKWHVTDADIRLNDTTAMLTFDKDGRRLLDREKIYHDKNVLSDYGYQDWIGPDPHGALPELSGSSVPAPEKGRDIAIAQQTIETLQHLECSSHPWLLFASFVNPHDIATFGTFSNKSPVWDYPIDNTLPDKLFTSDFHKSIKDPLTDKPAAQAYYRDHYHEFFQPILNIDKYWRLYYTLMRDADKNMLKVWNEFKKSKHFDNTMVLFFSDHGDFLSSHGGLHQKWFAAYQEAIHIPLIISSPLLNNKHRDVYEFTSHIDILPTILGLAGLDCNKQKRLISKLSKKFSLCLPLPGTDLSPAILCHHMRFPRRPVYFNTQDNPTKGQHQLTFLGKPYKAVPDPCSVEAILKVKGGKFWKLTHYYSAAGTNTAPGKNILNELYNVTDDPIELNNLYGNPKYSDIQNYLNDLLNHYAFLNR